MQKIGVFVCHCEQSELGHVAFDDHHGDHRDPEYRFCVLWYQHGYAAVQELVGLFDHHYADPDVDRCIYPSPQKEILAGSARCRFPSGAVGEAPPISAVHAAKAASLVLLLPLLKAAGGSRQEIM